MTPETVSSVLQNLPVVLQRLQRRQTSFLTDALSAILALSKRILAAGGPCKLRAASDDEQHISNSSLSELPPQSSRGATADSWNGSGRLVSGLEVFVVKAPTAASAWPEAQAHPGHDALEGFTLEVAAMTAPLPTLADAPDLAALPPQEAAALLDRDSQCQAGLAPAQTTSLIAACMAARQQVAASEPVQGQQQKQESTRPHTIRSPAGDRKGNTAQLGKAVMLHAALTSAKCRAAMPEHLPSSSKDCDPFHDIPFCMAALLQAANESQVQTLCPQLLSLMLSTPQMMLIAV